jgi:CDP-glycerol glycerophosphotransferase
MAARGLARRLFEGAKHVTIVTGKRIPFVLNAARETVIAVRRFRYGRLRSRIPVDPRSVLFQSYGGRGYSCSPRAVYEAMLGDERFSEYELVWTLRAGVARALEDRGGYDVRGLEPGAGPSGGAGVDLDRDFGPEALEQLKRAVIVVYDSAEHYRALARAAFWITNSLLTDHVRPRSGQSYVQAWHGTPLKRLGNDIVRTSNVIYSKRAVHRRYRREGERATLWIAPSRFVAEKYVSAFDLARSGKQDAVEVAGYPRNDALSRITPEGVAAVKERLGVAPGRRVILYAPTWRDDEHAGAGFVNRCPVDFEALRRELGETHVILFRAHYLTAAAVDFEKHAGFLVDVSSVNEVNDLYAIADVLVTDYSSVFFDFANTGRPILFYMYDLEHYAEDIRGFYLSLDELPGPIIRTEAELTAAVKAASDPGAEADPALAERYREFVGRFTYLDDGRAARRVVERLFGTSP